MKLSPTFHKVDESTASGETERVLMCCEQARLLGEAGQYNEARSVLRDWWLRIGERPNVDGLSLRASAEVLLRVGYLSGHVGSAQQIGAASDFSKDLLSESLHKFEELGDNIGAAEALMHLAVCYWREGAYAEADSLLIDSLARFGDSRGERKCIAIINRATVLIFSNKADSALQLLTETAPLFSELDCHSTLGKYHNALALSLKRLWPVDQDESLFNRAIIEYQGAAYHFEQAGHVSYLAMVENNLGSLLCVKKQSYEKAHKHLDRARSLYLSTALRDVSHAAQVDDTRANLLMSEGRLLEAEEAARASVAALEKSEEKAALLESLFTFGKILCLGENFTEAIYVFTRARAIAIEVGDAEREKEAIRACIEDALAPVCVGAGMPCKAVLRILERGLYRRALDISDKEVTQAARLLGYKTHQTLATGIRDRHPELKEARSPVIKRSNYASKKRRRLALVPPPVK